MKEEEGGEIDGEKDWLKDDYIEWVKFGVIGILVLGIVILLGSCCCGGRKKGKKKKSGKKKKGREIEMTKEFSSDLTLKSDYSEASLV